MIGTSVLTISTMPYIGYTPSELGEVASTRPVETTVTIIPDGIPEASPLVLPEFFISSVQMGTPAVRAGVGNVVDVYEGQAWPLPAVLVRSVTIDIVILSKTGDG